MAAPCSLLPSTLTPQAFKPSPEGRPAGGRRAFHYHEAGALQMFNETAGRELFGAGCQPRKRTMVNKKRAGEARLPRPPKFTPALTGRDQQTVAPRGEGTILDALPMDLKEKWLKAELVHRFVETNHVGGIHFCRRGL